MTNLPKDLAAPSKPIFKSKTAAASLILIVGSCVPVVRSLFQNDPQAAMIATGVIYGLLRLLTKDRIKLYDQRR